MSQQSPDYEPSIRGCNQLLKGEKSAVDAYAIAAEKFTDRPAQRVLTELRESHQQSASRLEAEIVRLGGEPQPEAGAWGALTSAVQHAANLAGDASALSTLQRGEEHGIKEYKEVAAEPDLISACRAMLLEELLPRCERNLSLLEGLKQAD